MDVGTGSARINSFEVEPNARRKLEGLLLIVDGSFLVMPDPMNLYVKKRTTKGVANGLGSESK